MAEVLAGRTAVARHVEERALFRSWQRGESDRQLLLPNRRVTRAGTGPRPQSVGRVLRRERLAL